VASTYEEALTMSDPYEAIRAPQGAIAWTPTDGWIYDVVELPTRVVDGHYMLVVSERDGVIWGVTATTTAPLAAVLRIEADLTELVLRLNDIAEFVAGRLASGAS
jgi:hypothetical protein